MLPVAIVLSYPCPALFIRVFVSNFSHIYCNFMSNCLAKA